MKYYPNLTIDGVSCGARVARVRSILGRYAHEEGLQEESLKTVVTDLLVDIMHLMCACGKEDPADTLARYGAVALARYEEESDFNRSEVEPVEAPPLKNGELWEGTEMLIGVVEHEHAHGTDIRVVTGTADAMQEMVGWPGRYMTILEGAYREETKPPEDHPDVRMAEKLRINFDCDIGEELSILTFEPGEVFRACMADGKLALEGGE